MAQAVAAALRDVGMSTVVVSEEGDPATLYAGECLELEIRVFLFPLLSIDRKGLSHLGPRNKQTKNST